MKGLVKWILLGTVLLAGLAVWIVPSTNAYRAWRIQGTVRAVDNISMEIQDTWICRNSGNPDVLRVRSYWHGGFPFSKYYVTSRLLNAEGKPLTEDVVSWYVPGTDTTDQDPVLFLWEYPAPKEKTDRLKIEVRFRPKDGADKEGTRCAISFPYLPVLTENTSAFPFEPMARK